MSMAEKRLQAIFMVVIVAFAFSPFVAFLFSTGIIPAYSEYCYKNEYTGTKECTTYQTVYVWWLRIGDFLTKEHGFITALATIVLAAFTIRLWWSTDKLAAEAKSTAERQLRAYVFVESSRISNWEQPENIEIKIIIKNFGQTPATDFRIRQMTCVAAFPPIAIPEPTQQAMADMENFGSLAPQGAVTTTIEHATFSPADREGITNGTRAFYVRGVIKYTDAFQRERTTSFCLWLGGPVGPAKGSMHSCPQGNYAT